MRVSLHHLDIKPMDRLILHQQSMPTNRVLIIVNSVLPSSNRHFAPSLQGGIKIIVIWVPSKRNNIFEMKDIISTDINNKVWRPKLQELKLDLVRTHKIFPRSGYRNYWLITDIKLLLLMKYYFIKIKYAIFQKIL